MLCEQRNGSLDSFLALMVARYVENTLEENPSFGAKDLLSKDPSRQGRLKYWTTELCGASPHTFDFAITVRRLGQILSKPFC